MRDGPRQPPAARWPDGHSTIPEPMVDANSKQLSSMAWLWLVGSDTEDR
jgi:hypothetical protein